MREIFDRYRKAIITGGGVIVFILAGLLTMMLTSPEPAPPKMSEEKTSSSPQNIIPAEQSQSAKTIYAYITGEVKAPGVYKLSDDARIFQLVDMAGGFTSKADTESLNLAEFLTDGVHIHIGAKIQEGQPPLIPGLPATPERFANTGTTAAVAKRIIDINTATASELETLPGIGPVIAQRIVEYRNAHGNFARPENLVNVRGISQSKLAQILPHVTVSVSASRVIQTQSSAGKIDINRATVQELQRIPGVGPAISQRIVDYRNRHGRFTRPDDIMNVRGIGQAKFEAMKNIIVVR